MTSQTASLPLHLNRPDMVVAGGRNTDYVTKVERFPQDSRAAVASEFHTLPGGKGLNQAVAAARLGAKIALVGKLRKGWRAEKIMGRLKAEGIDTHHVYRTDNASPGVTAVLVDDQGSTLRTTFPGANRVLLLQHIDAAAKQITQAVKVSAQIEIPLPVLRHAFHLASRSKVKTMLDAGPPVKTDEGLLQMCTVLRADEAQALSGREVRDREGALKAVGL